MQNTPIITVTCLRDLPLLDLQAQSINLYLDINCPVYIVVNEDDTSQWFKEFDSKYRHYYDKHKLVIFTKKDFNNNWKDWVPSQTNPWAVGWETQQVLKLAVSTKIQAKQFMILDTQNVLIRPWSPTQYGYINNKIPARQGTFVMPENIWQQYSKSLGLFTEPSKKYLMSVCTPLFLSKHLCDSLIENRGGVEQFAHWFKHASSVKSEFILYNIWAEKQDGFWNHHYFVPEIEDWANPYLRDCYSEEEFLAFYNFLGMHKLHFWASINHRAWGNMSNSQYSRLCKKFQDYGLRPNFDDYRSSYLDLQF